MKGSLLPAGRAPARRESPEAGFTLVEVLVGALVLGIFISFVYGTVVSAFRVRKAVQSSTSAMASGTRAMDILARDVENAFWLPMEEFDAFSGEDEGSGRSRLDFLTTTDSRRQEEVNRRLLRSDVTEVGYRLREGEKGLTLFRREQFGVDKEPLAGGDYYKVLGGVQEFLVEYFERDPSGEGVVEDDEARPDWSAKEKKKLPRAARITLVLEGLSSDPDLSGETTTFRFERWVVFPGADDQEPEEKDPGGNNPGTNDPGR